MLREILFTESATLLLFSGFALFKAFTIGSNVLDTMTTQCMSQGKYCVKVWINAPSRGSQCNIMIHTSEGNRNIMTIGETRGWAEFAIPFSTSSNFEVRICYCIIIIKMFKFVLQEIDLIC